MAAGEHISQIVKTWLTDEWMRVLVNRALGQEGIARISTEIFDRAGVLGELNPLDMPLIKPARGTIAEIVGDVLDNNSAHLKDEVAALTHLEIYEQFKEIKLRSDRERALYAWRLVCADDPLKQAWALPVLTGGEILPGVVHYCREIKRLDNLRKASERHAAKAHQRQRSLEDTVSQLTARIREIQRAHAARPVQEDNPTQDHGQGNPDNTWTEIAAAYEAENTQLRRVLKNERNLRARLASLLEQKKSNGDPPADPLSAGIIVYAGPEFRDRYRLLFSDTGQSETIDALDCTIRYLCQRITDWGKAVIFNEFEYMPAVKCHFFKKNNTPAKGMRVFFTTNFTDRLTLYDIITPEEHGAFLQTESGRYKAIMDGRVTYTFDEKTHLPITASARELLEVIE